MMRNSVSRPVATTMRMPFGKFRGCAISGVPSWYLEWLTSQAWIVEPLATAVRQEAAARAGVSSQAARPAAAHGPAKLLPFERLATHAHNNVEVPA
jgi:hypothetical protein